VNAKLQEHYGITLPSSAARHITEYHAQQMLITKDKQAPNQRADIVIAESHSSMIPIVETQSERNEGQKKENRRKNKQLYWKEARLSLAHAQGSITPYFAATMDTVAIAGKQLLNRYIKNRPTQLDYLAAQTQSLPIGSGEVESAHRYVIQKRLNIAGAWWAIHQAKSMIALRVQRANNLWNNYWKKAA